MGDPSALLGTINGFLWHDYVLYAIVGTGVLFTIWSGSCQYRALTHAPRVLRGVCNDPDDPGAINHFQTLSAALSATVGLGNIGGVAPHRGRREGGPQRLHGSLGLVCRPRVADLDNVIGIGTGVMMFANLPICWLFGYQAMRAYREYVGRLKSGRMGPDHPAPGLDALLSGRDIEKR